MTFKRLLFLSSFLLITVPLFAQDVIVNALSGTVEIRETQTSEWKNALRGTGLSEGGTIRTGADGRAVLLFKNGSKIWLKEKTTINISQQKPYNNEIYLKSGSVKTRVPHLKFRERFRMRTATSLIAVRGTVFTFEADETGQPTLDVLFGEVKLSRTEQDSERELKKVNIPQGNGYTDGAVSLLTPEREILGLEDWSPGLAPEERRRDMIDNVRKRDEIRQFAMLTGATEREISQSQEQVKQEDFAAGRTLVDVHGNLVRVDQRLDRPDNKTLQILNVVKRTTYASGGFRKYTYNGDSGSRVDSLRAKVEFDQALPDNLNEFPGYFSTNKDTIHVQRSELVLANSGDADNVFIIALMGLRNASTNDIAPDLYIGTLQTSGGSSGRKKLFELKELNDLSVPGLTRFVEDTTIKELSQDGSNGDLYGNFAKRWQNASFPGNKLWLASEFFVINNAGNVRNISDYVGGTINFESLLKNSGAELGIFVKQDISNAPSSTLDVTSNSTFAGGNAANKNIDIVIIPDLFVSVVKSLSTSLDSISKSLDKSFESVSNAKK